MDVTREIELGINERIEWPDYDELNDAVRELRWYLLRISFLPMGGGEIIISAIQSVLSSILELKDVCRTTHVRERPQICMKDQLEFLFEL